MAKQTKTNTKQTNSNTEGKILKILEENARVSDETIADMSGISKSEVKKTIDRLKNKGIIMGFKPIINWKKINKEKISSVLQIKVIPQEREGFAKICKEISMDSRVKDVFVVTGDYDIHIYLEADNMDEISEFVTAKIATKKGVIGTNTHIVMKDFKRNGAKLFEEENKREIISI
ncbi:MAG: Lrp/AsnC family transcriptional regulator [Candidatus Altiarchaeum hamiconexum]|uniref:Lrp/AsnC family transcriptional regulator n=1 Tax=Candidatus Altarchaeum hamiconexum TaxID=1803513 RepID=A0A8J7YX93_9ARCH|nr:Lrp/AsnC family transcriptional regulator [Candidatus Altarchaeum hamiconexum]OIQ04959.1 MAG: hypothetical protein AUK59_05725 [Candidatus Altarchaeum sp. CG2_30_32_3053]PIN66921.1 MAG: hypothetical protein COV98_05655 [Candidatus Altarchaeum sp. CG12_big_fil_rev_8_21_14_0_65_33_22]PIV28254.1 MAG: hypothetical protein COS36_02800 [Candidatus Altarchaeum sp. CG03_land_8_20_14_0_80_32_618]PIX49455.1 MAG: hypothetical protein COZ53_00560 [Candidatus Altarchaeum sp. CG_4_8_14_3_um_filter_33_2054